MGIRIWRSTILSPVAGKFCSSLNPPVTQEPLCWIQIQGNHDSWIASVYRAICSIRWMYWTDWGSSPKIERASMDGTHRTVLHSTDLVWPNALTIDYETQTLYWMDASLNRLESSRTNGSERRHYSNTQPFIHHPFSLVFFQGNLFWSDWQLKAILGTSVDSNFAQINVLLSDLTLDPMGLTAACAERQQDSK